MNRRRRLGPAAAVGAVALALGVGAAGCGVGAESDPTPVDPETVPFGLLDAQTSTTETPAGQPVTVYLLSSGSLIAVDRSLPPSAGLADILELVVAGPTETEEALGITSAVAPGTVASVRTERGIAEVDLAESFGEISSADQIFALAQVVYALTGQPGIGAVAFTLEGEPIEVPRTDGTASDEPLTRDDFAAVAPG